MTNESLALAIGSLLITHGVSIISVLIWGFKHILKYNILLKDFENLVIRQEKLEKDVSQAHQKIRQFTGK